MGIDDKLWRQAQENQHQELISTLVRGMGAASLLQEEILKEILLELKKSNEIQAEILVHAERSSMDLAYISSVYK
tara:strand:+ start:503 stop:727 length:225 start_codon:yes stop_codon:yes gene_type:complete